MIDLHNKTRQQVKEYLVKDYDREVCDSDLEYIDGYINAYIESDLLFEYEGVLYLKPHYEQDFPWLLNDMRILCVKF